MSDDYPLSEEEKNFYTALGQAITKWAEVEEILFGMAQGILQCTREQAAVVYYRTPTLGARLVLIGDLMETIFPRQKPGEHEHPSLKIWTDLKNDINGALKVRNHLAHHPVSLMVDFSEKSIKSADEIVDSIYLASKMSSAEQLYKKSPFTPLKIDEIGIHILQVTNFEILLKRFWKNEFATQIKSLAALNLRHPPGR